MSGEALKEKALSLPLTPGSRYATLRELITGDHLDQPLSSEQLVRRIKETSGERWKTSYVQTYMKKFMRAGIVHAIKPHGQNQNYWVLADVSRDQALKQLGKSQAIREIEQELFSTHLIRKLNKSFKEELDELHDNFGATSCG